MASVAKSIGILGLEGYLIDVEVSVYGGVVMTCIVGQGDAAVKEAGRIESCLNQLDFVYPKKKIVVKGSYCGKRNGDISI